MDDPQVLARMRADWNARAGEDAHYYVAFGRREQDEEEFYATAADVVRDLEAQLPRLRGRGAALEIGCGPGRLLRPMSRHFDEIHGVDVSDQMVRLANQRLHDIPKAHAHVGMGSTLEMFPDGKFDLVYSYAVFQHIPSRDVVFEYLREAYRVLRPGGLLRCQLNGLPAHMRQYDTWSGVRISPDEISAFTRATGYRLLALEQIWTQYMWITCRKPDAAGAAAQTTPTRIRNITNAVTGESAAPVSGPMASLSLWVENLPPWVDLNSVAVTADGRLCRPIYIGEPAHDGVSQINVALPEAIRTGLVPVELSAPARLCEPAWVRIIPAGPSVPRLVSISDGVNLISGNRIASGTVKVTLSEIPKAEAFRALVDGKPPRSIDSFCVDPLLERYEFNFHLPAGIGSGPHEVRVSLGRREFAPQAIEVV